MKKKYSLKDIAARSGVSIGTVDRVIHKRGRVSEASIKKVNKILEELDYTPNPMARSLRNNTVHKIGLLLPNPKKDSFWTPCEAGILEVRKEFKAFDIELNVQKYDPSKPKSFSTLGNRLLEQQPEALLFASLFDKEGARLITKLDQAKVLSASFNSLPKQKVGRYVGQDLVLSGRVAAKLLHSTLNNLEVLAIIHIDEPISNAVHMQDKENGFKQFFEDQENQNPIYVLTLSTQNLIKGLKDFIKEQPRLKGVFVTNSKTYEVASALQLLKHKAKVVGYDLLPQNIDYLKSGQIAYLIHQSPKLQVSLSLRGLIETLLFGKEFPSVKLLPIEIVNSENIKSYL